MEVQQTSAGCILRLSFRSNQACRESFTLDFKWFGFKSKVLYYPLCPWAHQFIFPCLCPHLRNGANNVSWPTCNTSTNWGPWKELPKQESSFLRERDGCGRKRWKGERLWSFHLTLLGPVQRQIWYKFPRLCTLPTKGGAGAESCLLQLDSLSPWKSQWLVLMTKL